jgi:hypothetical protein
LDDTRSAHCDDVSGRINRGVWTRLSQLLRRRTFTPGAAESENAGANPPSTAAVPERCPSAGLLAKQAFARISRERQELLWQRFFEGAATEVIATRLSLAPAAVERELRQAREEFRMLLRLTGQISTTDSGVGMAPPRHKSGAASRRYQRVGDAEASTIALHAPSPDADEGDSQ